jgi:thiol-disulfide isomerase/thioredoxin|tara:strand:- start:916 stop:1557 length:642 start_codon:yes stop_codon:yes gene_type:complete
LANRRKRQSSRVSGAAQQGARTQQKNYLKYGMGAAASIAVIALIVFVIATGSSNGEQGSDAPDFEVSLFQGVEEVGFREGNLSALYGQPMILNFWAGQCPPCRAEMPQFQAFYEDFKDEIMLLGVDIEIFTGLGTRSDAESLLRELDITYLAGWTDDRTVPNKYRVTAMPTTVFISSDGTIFEKSVGAIDANFLARVSQELLAAESTALNHGG